MDTLMHVGGLHTCVRGLQSTGSMQREPVQQSWAVTLHVAWGARCVCLSDTWHRCHIVHVYVQLRM